MPVNLILKGRFPQIPPLPDGSRKTSLPGAYRGDPDSGNRWSTRIPTQGLGGRQPAEEQLTMQSAGRIIIALLIAALLRCTLLVLADCFAAKHPYCRGKGTGRGKSLIGPACRKTSKGKPSATGNATSWNGPEPIGGGILSRGKEPPRLARLPELPQPPRQAPTSTRVTWKSIRRDWLLSAECNIKWETAWNPGNM